MPLGHSRPRLRARAFQRRRGGRRWGDVPGHRAGKIGSLTPSELAARVCKPAFGHRVLKAMARVPRHEFVPVEVQSYSYEDMPVPIGLEKTISQPFIVA